MSKTIAVISQDPQDAILFDSMLDRFYDVRSCGQGRDLSSASDEEVADCVRQSDLLVAIGGGSKVDAALRAAEQAKVTVVWYVPPSAGRSRATITASLTEALSRVHDEVADPHSDGSPAAALNEWRPVTADEPRVGERVSLIPRNQLGQHLGRIDECRRLSDYEWSDGRHPFTVDGYLADWRPS